MDSTACPICLDDAADGDLRPRSLQCGHSVCTGCLGHLLQQVPASHNCPVCRTPLGPSQLSDFPLNYALETLLDVLHARQMGDANGFELRASDLQLRAETLGTGRLGVVKAGSLQLGSVTTQVAVKMLAIQAGSAAQQQPFKQEIQRTIHAARYCPQVCRVLGFCFKGEQLCLVMLRYSGSLAACVEDHPLSQQQAIRVALQLAKGVQQLHALRILHLDIKPQNALMDQHGDVVLSDFGISQQFQNTLSNYMPSTSEGMMGTACYMSPEAARPDNIGLQYPADVWSLAATITFAFSGIHPYQGLDIIQIISALNVERTPPSVPASVPGALRRTLEKCFCFEPTQRPQVEVLVQTLQALQDDSSPPNNVPSPSSGSHTPEQQQRVPAGQRLQQRQEGQQQHKKRRREGRQHQLPDVALSPDNDWRGVFIAAGSFDGDRAGFVYKHGHRGLGYYEDVHSSGPLAVNVGDPNQWQRSRTGQEQQVPAAVNHQRPPNSVPGDDFIGAVSFDGPRLGYFFKLGLHGLGYYLDAQNAGSLAPEPAVSSAREPANDSATLLSMEMLHGFLPMGSFSGARPGCVFQNGPRGLGYYLDSYASRSA